ncbi:hypothetical protein BGZ81_008789 [Podila clonocystis]|nr:hypothetical protein BGZ81_008789 [Podila clonocystis]
MEDCSRLFSQQKQAQVRQEEGELQEDPTVTQHHVPPQHRRYSSVHQAQTRHQNSKSHTPQPSLRSRRNTIVARSPAPNALSPRTYQLVDPGVQKRDITTIKPFGEETQIDTNYDPWANVARNISAGNFTDPTPISPLDNDLPQPSRPWNCSRQGSRRSSQSSYAQDFSKDGDRYRPRIWANSNPSYAPSISSSSSMPSPLSMYQDDENVYPTLDKMSLRVKSRYREMKEIQLRPYGQDDEDEVDDIDADNVAEIKYSERPVHPFDNSDTHNDLQDVDMDTLNPYKQALKEDYDASPRASDIALSEESQQELYRMAFASSPAPTRMQQYQVPEYGHYYPNPQKQQHTLTSSITSNSIASSGTLKSKGHASLTRTKTVLRQVKRRVSAAAQTMVTQANNALVRKNTESAVNRSPQEDHQLWIQEEEKVRDEECSHHLDDSHDLYQRYDYVYDHRAYSSEAYHDHHRQHDEHPTSPMYGNHSEDDGSLGRGSRFGSSNSIRRNLYSASRNSLHRSKTLLRQVKRRVSNAAQSMASHAGSALSWKQSQDGSMMEEMDGLEERNGSKRVQIE